MVEQKPDVDEPNKITMAVLSKDRVRKINNIEVVQACRVVEGRDICKDMPAQLPP